MRRHDWASRMFAVIDDYIHRRFEDEQAGCSLFPARVHDAMTGSDFVERLLSEFKSPRDALKVIAEPGRLRALVMEYLGTPSEGRPMRGDVVLFDGGEGDSLGIWDGAHILAMGAEGLHKVKRSEMKAFWAVR